MKLIASDIASARIRPDIALVSPSARTRETWSLTGLGEGVETLFDPAIYDAEPETLLDLVRGAPDAAGSAILVGHNPGVSELAQKLARAGRGAEAARLAAGLPTAALAIFDLPVATWRETGWGVGTLVRLVTPADLGGGPDA